jgi:hypothetical protein
MFPQLNFSPTVNVNRKTSDNEHAVSQRSAIDPAFLLMVIALVFMSGAVLALSGALLVHAAKS